MTKNPSRAALARVVPGPGVSEDHGVRAHLKSLLSGYLEWNRGLTLDPWLRYRPVLPLIRKSRRDSGLLLDVGSGSVGLAFFLQRPVVSADVAFSSSDMGRFSSPIRPVRASATQLPFRDGAFRGVVSVDMLEHIPKQLRAQAIQELFRVSKDFVVIGFPYGDRSAAFDRRALEEEKRRGVAPLWREEHVRNGTPGSETHELVLEAAQRSSPSRSIGWFGQEGLFGLRLRWKLQFLVGRESRLYGLIFAPLYAIHARGVRRRAYRRFYVGRADPNLVDEEPPRQTTTMLR